MASRREEQSLLGNSRSNGTSIVSSEFKNTKSMNEGGTCPINQNVNKLRWNRVYYIQSKNEYLYNNVITNVMWNILTSVVKGYHNKIHIIICQYNSYH